MKAFAFDLDDTLLRDDRSVSDYTLETIDSLRKQGVQPIPSSGRTRKSMLPILQVLDFHGIFIACNGAEVWHTEREKPLLQLFLPADLYYDIIRFGNRHQVYMQTYERGRFLFNHHSVFSEMYAASSMLEGCCAGNLMELSPEERTKILMIDREEKIAQMYAEAVGFFGERASVSCSKTIYLEFNPKDATKGNALRFVADCLGIDVREIVAFGDGINDLPMLQEAGLSVAVANARDELKHACDHVCGSNEEDGVAHFLNVLINGVIA